MKIRKRKKQPQPPVVRAVMTINCNYVKFDIVDVIEETIATGRFPCELAESHEDKMFYVFTKTRWHPHRNITLLMTKQLDATDVIFQVLNDQKVDTFDDKDCPVSPEQWADLGVVDWDIFKRVTYTLVNMAFIDAKQQLAGTQSQCLYGGDMQWLHPKFRALLLKKVRDSDPDTQAREYAEFKRLAHQAAERYRTPNT